MFFFESVQPVDERQWRGNRKHDSEHVAGLARNDVNLNVSYLAIRN